MAFYVLLQASPAHEDITTFFNSEGEFVSELVQLLQASWQVPEDLRTLALRALTGMPLYALSVSGSRARRHFSCVCTFPNA